jgi:hypothetical protein
MPRTIEYENGTVTMKCHPHLLAAALTLSALMAGCSAALPIPVVPANSCPTPVGFVTMVGRLQIFDETGKTLLALVTAYNLGDVNHVLLSLSVSSDGGVVFTPTGATKLLTNAQIIANTPISMSTLKFARTYKITATASSTADDLAANKIDNGNAESVTLFSTSAITLGNDTVNANATVGDTVEQSYTLPTRIGVKLRDKIFAGTASSSSGVGVTNGAIANPVGNEVFN